MAFTLVGEVVLDGRKGTTALKDLQREANKTSATFKQGSLQANKLSKSLVGIALSGGRAGSALGALTRLGAGGIFGAAALGAVNKFGQTIKQASTDYYSAQKDLASAFETSFKSTSVDQAQAALEKTEDTIESLRGKITQLGPMAGIMKSVEKMFGIDLGVSSTQKTLRDTEALLDAETELLRTRKEEEKITKQGKQAAENAERNAKANKILTSLAAVRANAQEDLVANAEEELKLAQTQLNLINQQISKLYELKDVGVNIKLIDELTRAGREKDLTIAQKRLSLEQATQNKKAADAKVVAGASGGVLGASRAGQQALDVARKQRERQLKTENFKVAERVAPTQRDREKLAAQQVAGETPSLGERIQGGLSGVDPSEIARQAAATKFEKDRAVPQGVGSGTGGKLGEEQSSLGKETLQAIKALVDMMKSGTVVQ